MSHDSTVTLGSHADLTSSRKPRQVISAKLKVWSFPSWGGVCERLQCPKDGECSPTYCHIVSNFILSFSFVFKEIPMKNAISLSKDISTRNSEHEHFSMT